MDIRKENVSLQWLIIACVCIFGCGAYFVFDSPACIQRYLMAAMGFTSSEYMDLYVWYSAPNVLTCILGGVLIDMIGRRLGGIIFCTVIFLGQLVYSYSISMTWVLFACIGRTIIGAGVEAVAVCSNCYLTWWFEGSKLKPLAFGLALSIWRMSSSISLVTMLPVYESINTVDPVDGSVGIFSSCVQDGCDGGAFFNATKFDKTNENNKAGNFYCYDKLLWDTCEFSPENAKNTMRNDKQFCTKWVTKDVENFVAANYLEKSIKDKSGNAHSCIKRAYPGFEFDEELCKCLDINYFPSETYFQQYADYDGNQNDATFLAIQDPFYWIRHAKFDLGEYTSQDDFIKKHKLFQDTKAKWCNANFPELAGLTLVDNLHKSGKVAFDNKAVIMNPHASQNRTVMSFVNMLKGNEVYQSNCKDSSYLAQIPSDDTEARIDAAATIYYYMLSVTILSVAMAIFLYWIDGKAEANHKATNQTVEEEKEPFSVAGLIQAFLEIPMPILILFGMCVCFYIGVFTFITQAPLFFEKHSGLGAQTAAVAAGLVYILAVPCNPILGSIVTKLENEQIFLMSAFILSGLAHFIMLSFKHILAAFGGMFLLAIAYAIIGTTMWPLVGTLVPEKNVGKVFGLMFATQQLGLTIAAKAAGFIVDQFGFVTLELFFVVLQGIGAFGGFTLIGMIGRTTPKGKKQEEDPKELKELLNDERK